MDITALLIHSLTHNASDLHLSSGLPPMIRVDGDLYATDLPVLSHSEITEMLEQIMSDAQRRQYETGLQVDFSFELPRVARFRVNVFSQSRGVSAAFRLIPFHILCMKELGLSSLFNKILFYHQGLVLLTGPTGSGKSTTIASLIEFINLNRRYHVITIEDPIEFVHNSKKCLIHQREIYRDTPNFSAALHAALREDPDVIMIGELRDKETIQLALTAAETGHLVIGSLHTNSATKAINRIIDVFSGEERNWVRSMLSESLQVVIAQQLVKKIAGGRMAVFETMICSPAIRHLIRENKVAQMYSCIQTGQSQGMFTLDQCLMQLVQDQIITKETAQALSDNKLL